MKVAVYTIALNEAAHVERWANSAADADYRIVADTGSTDDTVERLLRVGVTVHRIAVRPWRFDIARNAAMALIPADVDVCCTMDMDVSLTPGWRRKLEAAWASGMTGLFCRMELRRGSDDTEPLNWFPSKSFHSRWGYCFKRAVHEALYFSGDEVTGSCLDIVLHHVQDHSKSTRRQYLPLMEIAHREDPDDAQICFWLGRDLMWAGQHERASKLLRRYLGLPTSTWRDERAEAMRYLARLQPADALGWLDRARGEAPHRREVWLDLAEQFYAQGDWLNLFWACVNGIDKTRRSGSYLDDGNAWGGRIYDLGALACWHLDIPGRALDWGRRAAALNPGEPRLRANLEAMTGGRAAALAAAPHARLFTSWGTAVYVDTAAGEVRHGPPAGPDNAALLGDAVDGGGGRHAWLAHRNGGARAPELAVCGVERARTQARAAAESGAAAAPTGLRIVPLERGIVGLRAGGYFLCAEPDGRLTLSKPLCSTWECFLPSDDWPEAAAGAPPADSDPAIDWPRIRSFAVPPSLRDHLTKPLRP